MDVLLNAKILCAKNMNMHEINIYIYPKLKISVKKIWFKTQMNNILGLFNFSIPSELGLVITNNETMQVLNKTYRKMDLPTDVLAFSMVQIEDKEVGNISCAISPDGVLHLGEIIISYPQAKVQAESKGHNVRHELLILMVHGVLHLLGYDHEQSTEKERRMKAKEEEILKKLTSV